MKFTGEDGVAQTSVEVPVHLQHFGRIGFNIITPGLAPIQCKEGSACTAHYGWMALLVGRPALLFSCSPAPICSNKPRSITMNWRSYFGFHLYCMCVCVRVSGNTERA